MSKVALFIAIAAMLGSAILGFMTKGKIQVLDENLKGTKATLSQTQGKLTTTEKDLVTSKEETVAANKKTDEAVAEVQTKQGELTTLQQAKGAVDAELTTALGRVAELEGRIANIGTPPGPGADEGNPQLADLNAKLQDAESRVAELQTVNSSLQSQMAPLEARNKDLESEEVRRANKVHQKGLEGQVLAVNQSWNFAVLSIGDRQGVVAGARLLVVRNGDAIATVKISSVEPTTSIADIVPGSVARGARVSPGDKVIFAGTEPVAGS